MKFYDKTPHLGFYLGIWMKNINFAFTKFIRKMRRIFLLLMFALLVVSCSKKVEVKGKITNPSPLDRVEITDASGVATLPLVNMGLNAKGEFSGSFEAPKDGMYAITYAGGMGMVYLERGQTLDISGDGASFPGEFKIVGDAKANNDFVQKIQTEITNYFNNLNVHKLITEKEPKFLTTLADSKGKLLEILEDNAKKFGASEAVLKLKQDEVDVALLGVMDFYERQKKAENEKFVVSADFKKMEKKLQKYNDRKIRTIPQYREFVIGKIAEDYTKYSQKIMMSEKPDEEPKLLSQVFSDFLKTRKDLSALTKEYLFAYVISQTDINPEYFDKYDKIKTLIDENVTDAKVKKDLEHLQVVLMGGKVGSTPKLTLVDKNGKKTKLSDFKGKPTLLVFYASWNPNIGITTMPILKEVVDFYKSKAQFAYINVDDTMEQFSKTSGEMLKGFTGNSYWVEGGLNSQELRTFGVYGFRTPSYVILDANGKIYSKPFFNLGEAQFVDLMSKVTGIKAPEMKNEVQPMMVPNGLENLTPEQLKALEEAAAHAH